MLMRHRAFLSAGLTGLASLSLPGLLALRARAAAQGERKALLVVWLQGGASHLETYDPKPDAPSEVRGPFGSIRNRKQTDHETNRTDTAEYPGTRGPGYGFADSA
jgi:hypothetical protein